MGSERFVTTADYDATTKGRIRNWWRDVSSENTTLGLTTSIAGDIIRRPILLTSTAIAIWLLFQGWPWWLALNLMVWPQVMWSARGLARLLVAAPRQRSVSQILPALSMWWRSTGAWRVAAVKAGIKQPGRRGSTPALEQFALTHTGISALVRSGNWGYTQQEMATLSERVAACALAPKPVEWLIEHLDERWHEPLGLIPSARNVTVTGEDEAGKVRVWWSFTDPLADLIPITALVRPPSNMLAIGQTEHGPPAMIPSFLPILIVGMQNSGKSGLIWTIICNALMKDEPFEIWAIDPKGGVELYELGQVAGLPGSIVKEYARDRDGIRAMIRKLHNRKEMRENAMRGTGNRYHVPTQAEPRIYVVIDELIRAHDYFTAKVGKEGSVEPLWVNILVDGRALGITPVCGTQIPFGHSIGEKVRSLFPIKIVGHINDTFVTSAMFGREAEALGVRATKIKITTPGIFYVNMDQWPMPIRFRTPFMTDGIIKLIAQGVLPDGIIVRDADEHPEMAAPMGLRDNRDYALYRWDTPDGGLQLPDGTWYEGCLYVGISNDVARRAMEHLSTKAKKVLNTKGVRMELIETWTAADCVEDIMAGRTVKQLAADHEENMIRELQPPLNIAHNGNRKKELTRG